MHHFMRLALSAACLPIISASGLRAADRDFIEDSDFTRVVRITFAGTSATVSNDAGVTVSFGTTTSRISIQSAVRGVEYVLAGTTADGFVEITSTHPAKITLNGVDLTSTDGPALSVVSGERGYVVLPAGTTSLLTDSASYTRAGTGTLYATGPLVFSGSGVVQIAGLKGHAVHGKSSIRCLGGEIRVTAAVKDAIHSKSNFQIDHGKLILTSTGDGIDGDTGNIVINGGSLSIQSTIDDTKCITCDGHLTLNGGALDFTVAGVRSKGISCGGNIAINGGSALMQLSGAVFLETVTGTSGTYVDPSYCTAVKCDGNIGVAGGSITVTHTGLAGKGISAGGDIAITGGILDLATSGGPSAAFTNSLGVSDMATADCLKADGNLTISNGTITALSSGISGDCLSADLAVAIHGGTVTTTVAGASGDCIASATTLTLHGGNISVNGKGAQSKGLKSSGDMLIDGGTLVFAMSGAVVLELATTGRYDPSYCTAIKTAGSLSIAEGTLTVTHTGQAGKGISAAGNISITGGTISLITSGTNTAAFVNSAGTTDMAAADCLKADGNLAITGGALSATSTGTAGDAISCDGIATFGVTGVAATPIISASATGARVLLSGSGMNGNYVNPKAFQAGGNLTIHGGKITANTTQTGGEGIESKANLTINGGTIEVTTADDGINAKTKITVNGGLIYCYASGNDGMDSNGTFLIAGGTIITSGAKAPEEGFDCDQNNFAITGGILVGTGGATSTPTAASCTQRAVIYKGPGTANVVLQVRSAAGVGNLVYKVPRTYGTGTSMTLLFSNPVLASGTTYSIVSGATVSGGSEFHGLYTGATVSGGTALKTFNPTAMVTTVQ